MNKLKSALLAGSCLLLTANAAFAMDIKGKVIDAETGATLSGAAVDLEG